MVTKLFIGSLPWSVRDEALKEAFQQAGEVISATVIIDRATEEDAQQALVMWNEKEFAGGNRIVNIARPREDR